jgi:hypothetical protein
VSETTTDGETIDTDGQTQSFEAVVDGVHVPGCNDRCDESSHWMSNADVDQPAARLEPGAPPAED